MSVEKVLVAMAVGFIAATVARWVFPDRDSRYGWVGWIALTCLIVIVVAGAFSVSHPYPHLPP